MLALSAGPIYLIRINLAPNETNEMKHEYMLWKQKKLSAEHLKHTLAINA